MNRLTKLILLLAALSLPSFANERFWSWCQQGGQQTTVLTYQSSPNTPLQASYPTCTVTVYVTGTVTLATLYSDNLGTPLANPFTATANGYFEFYAANGRYDVMNSGGSPQVIPTPFTLGDILLYDPAGANTFPSCTMNQLVYYAAAGTSVTCLTLGPGLTITAGVLNGGGGVPGLPFNSVQYNNAGSLGGSSGFTFDGNAVAGLGTAGVTNGILNLFNSTSPNATGIGAGPGAAPSTNLLPVAIGTDGDVLGISSIAGTVVQLSWIPNGSGSAATSLGLILTTAYSNLVVTVPGPTSAPVLTASGAPNTAGTFASGTFEIAYTFIGWSGETALSPPSAAITNQLGTAAIQFPGVPPGSPFVGIQLYASPSPYTTWYKMCPTFCTFPQPVTLVQPGDVSNTWGGVLASYSTSGGTYTGGGVNTAVDAGSNVIANPTTAPVVNFAGAIATGMTLCGAFAYVAGDGTETTLSNISTSATTSGANGNYVTIRHQGTPPSGAVYIHDYLGTTCTLAGMHLQASVPLHYVQSPILSYNASGAAPSAGTAQSTISPLQQAIDAGAALSTTASIWMPPSATPISRTVPIIWHTNNTYPGMVVQCGATGTLFVNGISTCSSPYTGIAGPVDNILVLASNATWQGIDVTDPNKNALYGLAWADYGGFTSSDTFHHSAFSGLATGGTGCITDVESAFSTSHNVSEQYGDLSCYGDAWGFQTHGEQVENMAFDYLGTNSLNAASSANSGQVKLAGTPLSINRKHLITNLGRYTYLITGDPGSGINAGGTNLKSTDAYTEMTSANNTVFLGISSTISSTNPAVVKLNGPRETNGTGHRVYALLNWGNDYINVESTQEVSGDIINGYGSGVSGNDGLRQSRLILSGINGTLFGDGGLFKGISPYYTVASGPLATYTGAVAFCNGSAACGTVQPNSAGGISVGPNASPCVIDGSGDATCPGYVNAVLGVQNNGVPVSLPAGNTSCVGSLVTCAPVGGVTATNTRGAWNLSSSTATTGVVATVSFSTTLPQAPGLCIVTENGGSATGGGGTHSLFASVPTTSGFTVSAGSSISGVNLTFYYQCIP